MAKDSVSQRLLPYLRDYQANHQTRGNQLTHAIGLPAILITSLTLLSQFVLFAPGGSESPFRLDAAILLWCAGTLFYVWLDWKIGIPFSLTVLGFYGLARSLPLDWAAVIWGLGWVLQFVGHFVYEKKSPAFFQNLTHLLIGPLWLFVKLVGYDQGRRA